MSNYPPVMPTGVRPRPPLVTAAGNLLYVVAGLYTLSLIISIATFSKLVDVAESESATSDVKGLKSVVEVASIAGIVVDVLVVALFVVLGVFVLRGRNAMRITTWVVAGLGALCTLCGSIGGGLSATYTSQDNNLTSTQSEQLRDALPGWARATGILIDVVILIALCLVIIFLALRSSGEFFRKPDPAMIVGYPGYPAYPTFPQQGQPGQAGQPGYPQDPAGASPWAVPGGMPPNTSGGAADTDPTRQDPDQR